MRISYPMLAPAFALLLGCGGSTTPPGQPDGGLPQDGSPDSGATCSSTTTAENCGACGNACPGRGKDTADVACADPKNKLCDLTCRGENYDVDKDPSNGCEQLHTGPGHTRAAAIDRGSFSCFDTNSKDELITASLLSDSRIHTNPMLDDFSGKVGTTVDYFKVTGTGGTLCENDYKVTFETKGGGTTECYRCTIITDKTTDSVQVSGAGSKSMSAGAGSYSSNTVIYFKIEKFCALPVQEAVAYKISYHL